VVGHFTRKTARKCGAIALPRPFEIGRDFEMSRCWCGKVSFNAHSSECWWHLRTRGECEGRSIAEISGACCDELAAWGEIELWDRAVAVYPKMADRLATLLGNLDSLSVTEGRQFVNALFSPTEVEFLRSRAEEIWAALGTPA
jgi:hypothetical protein